MLFHKHIYHVTSSLVQTIPPLTHMNIRTMHCKIALTHFQSFDHLITCAILSYLTILTFTAQHSQIYTRDTAKLNAFASHNDRFRSSEFCTSIFFHIISATVYDPNLTFFDCTDIVSLLLVRQLWKSFTLHVFNLEWITFYTQSSGFKV